MKFFLAKDVSFTGVKEAGVTGSASFVIQVNSTSIQPANKLNLEEIELCNTLRQHLESLELLKPSSGVSLLCEVATLKELEMRKLCFRIVSGPLTNALVELFGEDDVSVRVRAILEIPGYDNSSVLSTSYMKIRNGKSYAFEEKEAFYSGSAHESLINDLRTLTCQKYELNGRLTVLVSVDIPEGPVVTDKLEINRKMLQEGLGSDVIILAENGKEVNAHKGVLMTHSHVFNAMFQSDMQEARTSTVEMPDVSEEGVRGLLAYLYCWETTEPKAKPMLAFEMFYAGHKYDIPVLEATMKTLLLTKPNNWYTADAALKLFTFAKKLPEEDGNRLKMKAVRVMKGNFKSFKTFTTYSTLFKEDPETAMELCDYFAA